MKKINILVADDSFVFRSFWGRALKAQEDMHVVGSASNGREVLQAMKQLAIDLVILDLEMPEMDGFEALPLLRKGYPKTKILVVSSLATRGSEAVVRALTLGASDYVTKPAAADKTDVAAEIIRKVRILFPQTPPEVAVAPPSMSVGSSVLKRRPRAIVIGSSTGGPNALMCVLSELPSTFDVPILIVQHMPPSFITALVDRMRKETSRPCQEGVDGEIVRPGNIYVAPGDKHMVTTKSAGGVVLRLNQDPPENFCRPAVDPLFRSAAKIWGNELLAVVLTGMGEDGKRGSQDIVAAGGVVWVQDEATSVVWGMPGAVARANLASAILPIEQIGSEILQRVG